MKKTSILALLILITYASLSNAEDETTQHESHQSSVTALSPELRALISSEMNALQEGMMSIIPANVAGDLDVIEATAKAMKNSYVMKQQLSSEQKHELHSLLPPEFIKKDQQFHYLAGMLEHAAEKGKTELVNFYFSEMNKSCVSCHSQFATHRFPKLAPKTQRAHSH